MNSDHLSRFVAVCGEKGVLVGDAVSEQYTHGWAKQESGTAAAVVMPANTGQVSAVLSYCNEHGIGVVPQGGHTGLSGGAIPRGDVVLAMRRMNRLHEVDVAAKTLTADAGCVLEDAQQAATAKNLYFPINLGAKGSCQLGGNLATNAGGLNVLRYGTTRDLCLGVEAVLADGRILNLLSGLRKNNTGYDIKNLLIGSEGTLGVITAATFKLFPPPSPALTAWVRVPGVDAAVALLNRLQSGGIVGAFEIIPQLGFELLQRHCPDLTLPFSSPPPWGVLLEMTDMPTATAEELIAGAMEEGLAEDVVVAASETQRREFWRLREDMPTAVARVGDWIRTDIAVPLSATAALVADLQAALPTVCDGTYFIGFGHLGDGNFHIDARPKHEEPGKNPALSAAITEKIYDCATAHNGTISAEHGVGKFKTAALKKHKDGNALAVMRDIKRVMDPRGIMNPGCILA